MENIETHLHKLKESIEEMQDENIAYISEIHQKTKKIKTEIESISQKSQLLEFDIPKKYKKQGMVVESGKISFQNSAPEFMFYASISCNDIFWEKAIMTLHNIFQNACPLNAISMKTDEAHNPFVNAFVLSSLHLNPNIKTLCVDVGPEGVSQGYFDIISKNPYIESVIIKKWTRAWGIENQELLNLFRRFDEKRKFKSITFTHPNIDLSDFIQNIKCEVVTIDRWQCTSVKYIKNLYQSYRSNIHINQLRVVWPNLWSKKGFTEWKYYNNLLDSNSGTDDEYDMIPIFNVARVSTEGKKKRTKFLQKAIEVEMYICKINKISAQRLNWWNNLESFYKLIFLAREYDENSLFWNEYLPLDMVSVIFSECGI